MPLAHIDDELRHPRGTAPWWNESVYLDWTDNDATSGGYLRIGLLPNRNAAWYWGALVRAGEPTILLIDDEVPLPSRSDGWELRSDGLWADYTVESPLEHVSAGLESFALAIDAPEEVDRSPMLGDRVAFGFELDWFTAGPGVYRWPAVAERTEAPCRVEGNVLLGDETMPVDAVGQRDHSWGDREWFAAEWTWTAFHFPDGRHIHTTTVWLGDAHLSFGYTLADGRYHDVHNAAMDRRTPVRPDGTSLIVNGESMEIEPVGWAPAPIRDGDRSARLDRALARVHHQDGTVGVGWWERHHIHTG
ncbi:MAG: hypothetical protein KDB86_11000 [Actinobacteria bacterium]|nr:hypothetical protein [Actinomycetota bacterium]MCB9389026.1 hypothetical protein [Acidimicrobiia bacterium]